MNLSPDDDGPNDRDLDGDDLDIYNDDENEFNDFQEGNSDLSAELEMEYIEAMEDADQSDGQGNNTVSDQDAMNGSMGDSGFV